MKLRVIEEKGNYGANHYTPQYLEEGRGWRECYLVENEIKNIDEFVKQL